MNMLQAARQLGTTWVYGRLYDDPFNQLLLRAGRTDPYPLHARLRADGPITRSRSGDWVVTGHELANGVLRDRRFGVRNTPYDPGAASELGYTAGAEHHFSILEIDPPDHGRLRKLAAPAFSPRMMAEYRLEIERLTVELLDAAHGPFDLMTTVAGPLPIAVITRLLGIPDADAARFQRYGRVVGSSLDGVRSPRHAHQLARATRDIEELFAGMVRASAPDDQHLVGRLAADLRAGRLTPRELLALSRILLIAGFETTVSLIGNGVLALLRNPEQWRALRDDPELAGAAVEEILRYDSPVQATLRFAREDLELGGHRIARGDSVYVLLGAANRDPSVYSDPDRFDIRRAPEASHLAFGGGAHYCLGAPLSRLEGEVVFRALAERMPYLRLAGPVRRRPMMTLRGLAELPVT